METQVEVTVFSCQLSLTANRYWFPEFPLAAGTGVFWIKHVGPVARPKIYLRPLLLNYM